RQRSLLAACRFARTAIKMQAHAAWSLAAMTCGKDGKRNPRVAVLTPPEARSEETRPFLENPRDENQSPSRLPDAAHGGEENAHSTPHLARPRVAFRAGPGRR